VTVWGFFIDGHDGRKRVMERCRNRRQAVLREMQKTREKQPKYAQVHSFPNFFISLSCEKFGTSVLLRTAQCLREICVWPLFPFSGLFQGIGNLCMRHFAASNTVSALGTLLRSESVHSLFGEFQLLPAADVLFVAALRSLCRNRCRSLVRPVFASRRCGCRLVGQRLPHHLSSHHDNHWNALRRDPRQGRGI